MEKNALERFVENVRSSGFDTELDINFTVKEKLSNIKEVNIDYHFIKSKVGKAYYVYGRKSREKDLKSDINVHFELVAIVRKKNIYLVDEFFFGINPFSHTYSNGVLSFNKYLSKLNQMAREKHFQYFYDSLPLNDITDPEKINECLKECRKKILLGISRDVKPTENIFSKQNAADILSGKITITSCAHQAFSKYKEKYMSIKATHALEQHFINNKEAVAESEKQLYDALINTDKNESPHVFVYFKMQGKEANGMIKKSVLLDLLMNNGDITEYSFIDQAIGYDALIKLKAATKYDLDQKNICLVPVLKCSHIEKVIYLGKTIYSKT